VPALVSIGINKFIAAERLSVAAGLRHLEMPSDKGLLIVILNCNSESLDAFLSGAGLGLPSASAFTIFTCPSARELPLISQLTSPGALGALASGFFSPVWHSTLVI
jgi:hypothetical protein